MGTVQQKETLAECSVAIKDAALPATEQPQHIHDGRASSASRLLGKM